MAHGEYFWAVAVALSLFKPFSSRVLNHPPGQRAQGVALLPCHLARWSLGFPLVASQAIDAMMGPGIAPDAITSAQDLTCI